MNGNKLGALHFLLGIGVFLVSASTQALTAHSLTHKEIVREGGKEFWQIRVTCTDMSTKRFIIRTDEAGPWCSKDVSQLCGEDRIAAAVQVCSSEYRDAIASQGGPDQISEPPSAQQLAKQQQRAALLEEQINVERQRVELEQRKLDLRRREISLENRELELQQRSVGTQ